MQVINLFIRGKVIPVLRVLESGAVRLFTLTEITETGLIVPVLPVLTPEEAMDPRVTPEAP